MKSLEIISAVFNAETGFIEVAKEIVNDDDTIEYSGQSFHPETLEWWAAIYDTEDFNELIDMILHEPHVENIEPFQMSATEARTAQKTRVDNFKAAHKVKKSLVRTNVQVTLADSKLPQKFIDAAKDDPYQIIKDACLFDPEVLEIKREYVRTSRQKSIAQVERPKQDRATLLKSRLTKTQRKAQDPKPRKATGALPVIGLEGKKKRTE